ncbi:class I SAM-dependent methyltransferase [Plantactinospora sp. GCM10030261]|uniref:class I SAM-dependent methyltransferase n=1 Tax=Plantactinospora sp. GCM10030261 TaxID=3273420 RepID=UPI003621CAE8
MSTLSGTVLDMVNDEQTRDVWGRRAERYARTSQRVERLTIGDSRRWIGARATGRTLDVAAGPGRTFPWYDNQVRLVAVDASPGMLAVARRRATDLGRTIEVIEARAEALPFPDRDFDTVVCTLALCEVDDREASLDEMYRVLRPGGRLLLLDHLERRWRHGRPADLAIRRGFRVERRERLRLGLIERLAAIRPAA